MQFYPCWLKHLLNNTRGIILADPPPKRLRVYQPILKPPPHIRRGSVP